MAKLQTQAQLEKMTPKQLEAHRLGIQDDISKMRAYGKLVARVIDGKADEVNAASKLASMLDSEKVAMAQAIQAEGIESDESVGIPGAG